MITALLFTLGSILTFFAMAFCASFVAQRHHYYEDPDEDQKGGHHGPHGEYVWFKP